MDGLINYIFTPETLISIVSTIIGITVAWTVLKGKVEQLEKDVKEIQSYEIPIKIIEIQKDIQYMRETQDRIEKLLNER